MGRPKGRRPVVYVCATILNQKLICEEMLVEDQDPNSEEGSFPAKIAKDNFMKKFGTEPSIIKGPLFKKIGKKNINFPKAKNLERVDLDSYTFSSESKEAIYGPWKGMANVCVNNPEKSLFLPTSSIKESSGPLPKLGIANTADLIFSISDIIQ